jgi:hypothetical protein
LTYVDVNQTTGSKSNIKMVETCQPFCTLNKSTLFLDKCKKKWGVLDTTLCDKVCKWLAANQCFYPGTPVSSINKTDCNNITEILLKMKTKCGIPKTTKDWIVVIIVCFWMTY